MDTAPTVVPNPLVDWLGVASILGSAGDPTRARIDTLRRKCALSPGLRVVERGPRQIEGRPTLYSSLNLLSALLVRSGYDVQAQEVAAEGQRLEAKLDALLASIGTTDRRNRYLLISMHQLTAPKWARWVEVLSGVGISLRLTPARWQFIHGETAVICDLSGKIIQELPANSPLLASSRLGDTLVLLSEQSPIGVVTTRVIPGLELAERVEDSGVWEVSEEDARIAQAALREIEQPIEDTDATRAFFDELSARD